MKRRVVNKTKYFFSFPYRPIRFPVADLRPIHDPGRLPWWKRNVRPDFLLFNLVQLRFGFTLPASYVIEANELNLFYCVS